MINCLVIDDEPLARKLLEDFIRKTPDLTLLASCPSALKAREVLSKKKADIVFLDIQMPDLNGLDFLRSFQQRPLVILTTAFAEYAMQGYELDVIDYLLKPFDFNRFLKAVNKATDKVASSSTVVQKNHIPMEPEGFIFVRDGNKLVRVNLNDIRYIKGAREYVTIVTPEKNITTLQSMKSLEADLPSTFMRIHNSYIVNLAYINEVHKDDVLLEKELLPIGISYKKAFQSKIKNHLKN
jgi:two-component system, LytTR family, response regulator